VEYVYLYTREDMRICGICILVCIHEKICGYVEMFVEFDHQTFYTNNFEFTNLLLPTLKLMIKVCSNKNFEIDDQSFYY